MPIAKPPEADSFDEPPAKPLELHKGRGVKGGKGPSKHASKIGHGSSWIVTYSDMVTLLMAFFIALITFSTKESGGKTPRSGDSFVEGKGGSGVAGPKQTEDIPRDAVVWRLRFRQGPKTNVGAEFAPLYRDPSLETTEGVLLALAGTPVDKLGDAYVLQLPFGLLFGSNGKLTPSGSHVVIALANNLRNMPYDFRFTVRDSDHVSRAVHLCTFLSTQGGIHPSRMAVGVRAESDDQPDTVLLSLTPQT